MELMFAEKYLKYAWNCKRLSKVKLTDRCRYISVLDETITMVRKWLNLLVIRNITDICQFGMLGMIVFHD